jgi:hypothetical protein
VRQVSGAIELLIPIYNYLIDLISLTLLLFLIKDIKFYMGKNFNCIKT